MNNQINELTSKCWDIGEGLKTFALDLNGFPRPLDWQDLKFMRQWAEAIIEAQDNARTQKLTNSEK